MTPVLIPMTIGKLVKMDTFWTLSKNSENDQNTECPQTIEDIAVKL